MTSTEVSIRRSNKDVARSMLITGIALVVIAIALDFFANSLVDWLNSLSATPRDVASRLWSLAIRLGYSLGPVLIVGAIIVGRLPESQRVESE